jgi:hypothetical protein
VKYVRRNFLCGLLGREPANLEDLNAELRRWIAEVANQRVHGTTHQQVLLRWDEDQFAMQPLNGRRPYPYVDDEQRKVARDAYVSWEGSRYSVPWRFAGKEVWVRDQGTDIEILHGAGRIAVHAQAVRRHQIVTQHEHHEGIPAVNRQSGKTLIHIQQSAPEVERRPLAAYEDLIEGGSR